MKKHIYAPDYKKEAYYLDTPWALPGLINEDTKRSMLWCFITRFSGLSFDPRCTIYYSCWNRFTNKAKKYFCL